MFSLKNYNIPIDLLIHVIFKFVSYFELDGILPCFKLTPKETAYIKFKIYKQRITINKYHDKTEYRVENKLHREGDLPSIESTNGNKVWHINNELHRENDLPAHISNYSRAWFIHNKLHRENGPAIEWADGSKAWYLNDTPHRLNGPALDQSNGYKEWWEYGKKLTKL